jgi:hypothetical protein
MKKPLCLVAAIAVFVLLGCARPEPAPTEAPTAQTAPAEATPISSEDFESGEAEGVTTSGAETESGADAGAESGQGH